MGACEEYLYLLMEGIDKTRFEVTFVCPEDTVLDSLVKSDGWIAIKIFLTVFLISSLFFKPNPTLSLVRFEFLTKALTHYGTTWIDKVKQESGIQCIDSMTLNGHVYIETTPGLSFIGLVSYLPYSAFLQSKLIRFFSLDPTIEFKISQFVIALSTVILFTALLITVFFLSLRRIGCSQKKAIIFSFLLYFGTPVIFYSLDATNGQNILEASILFIAFFIMGISNMKNIGLIFLSGLLCGLAVFVNVALFFLPLFLSIILLSRRWQNFLIWTIGTILGSMPILIYNQISFGNLLRFSYNAKYGNFISLRLGGYLGGYFDIARIFLISPMVGLLFFFPFVIMLILMFKRLWTDLMNKLILFSALLYIGGLCIVSRPLLELSRLGNTWYLNQGGGGPRYLLPIIPFLLYVIASVKFDLNWKKILASVLIFISVTINAPGLFRSGGQPVFFNNLLLFCKNGFHSYMIDLIRDVLVKGGFNTNGLSIFPLLAILGIFLWWIWVGDRWVKSWLQ